MPGKADRRPQCDQAAVAPERPGACFQGRRGRNVVDDDIHPLAIRQIEQCFDDIGGAWVDDLIGTGLAAGVKLARRDINRNHSRSRPLREHNLMDSHSSAGTEYRNGFPGLYPRSTEHLVRGGERVGNDADLSGMLLVIQTRGQLDENMGGKLDVLGIAAVAVQSDIAAGVHAQRLEIHRHQRQ